VILFFILQFFIFIFIFYFSFDHSVMPVGHVIIIFESTYKDWKHDYNKSMTLEEHNLVQTRPDYPTLKATDYEVNNYD
jgi:hypothetical protein